MRYVSLAAAILVVTAGLAGAETAVERAKSDATFNIAKGDPAMTAAYRKARETLPEFLMLVREPRPGIAGFSVKVAVPYGRGNDAEFFWITPFEQRGERFAGRINNTPRMATTVALDQVIEFGEGEIVDWLYREDGRMHGNFTACAILTREPPDQAKAFMKQYGLSCEP